MRLEAAIRSKNVSTPSNDDIPPRMARRVKKRAAVTGAADEAKVEAKAAPSAEPAPRVKPAPTPAPRRSPVAAAGEGWDFDGVVDRHGTDSVKWRGCDESDMISMWVADMDFPAPQPILDALHRRVDHGVFGYAFPSAELIDVVVAWLKEQYNWTVDGSSIVWLPGLVPALNVACRAFSNEGDEVLMFTPVYPPFLSAPSHTGRQLRAIPLKRLEGRYAMDPERLAGAVSPQSSLLLLCSPHNPVGRRWDRQELENIAEVCLANNIVICSDEIHCDLILDGHRHVPTATLSPEIAANTVTLMAPSKTFNIPGLNCAFAVIENPKLRKAFRRAREGIVPHANALGYAACLAAYRDCRPWREALLDYLRANKDYTHKFINEEIPQLSMDDVQATYLAWIEATPLGVSDPARFFEERAAVKLFDGAEFGGEGHVRLNFACPRATLTEALERMQAAALNMR